ncbi:MAG TPA: hypothetical protein VFM98_01825 [Ramlibacter sp.]|uniref:hypothetical protein n=1 Tax=Ramlibacter sp. TaxID=1917967 RepID=UPI002D7F7421|nr:hypothetical protein [Ramlibacter sp.]HET8744314.1 hypothetical protein [Ramlibacter sp.]
MDPVNFNFADPSAAILNGIKQSAVLGQIQQDAQQRQLEMQAAQLKQQQAIQQQMDLRALAMNPNAGHADYARVMTQYPALAENLGRAFKVMDEGAQKNLLDFQSRVYAAQLSGNNDLAVQLLRERSKADPEQRQHYDVMANLIESNPAAARSITALGLAGAMGPEKFAEAFAKIGGEQRAQELQPDLVRKGKADASAAESDATIKAEKAKFASEEVALELQKKQWDIRALAEDIEIRKQANRISAMNAATAREGNTLKAQELRLKVQEAQQKLDDKVREKVATAETGAANIDNMLNTIERIKGNKSLNDVVGAIEGRLPAFTDDEQADAIALIDTLGSQAFLAQIPSIKGTGALSNAEGEKLQAALQNLSRKQSEKQFRANLDEAARLLKKGRENLSRATGVPLGKPDTPAAPGARPPLSSFEKR